MSWEEREARTVRTSNGEPTISEELRRQLEGARGGLGPTDRKAQAKQKLAEGKEQAASKVAQVREKVMAAAPRQAEQALTLVQQQTSERPVPAAFLAGLLTGLFIARRK